MVDGVLGACVFAGNPEEDHWWVEENHLPQIILFIVSDHITFCWEGLMCCSSQPRHVNPCKPSERPPA